jgi:hypothetical protein
MVGLEARDGHCQLLLLRSLLGGDRLCVCEELLAWTGIGDTLSSGKWGRSEACLVLGRLGRSWPDVGERNISYAGCCSCWGKGALGDHGVSVVDTPPWGIVL